MKKEYKNWEENLKEIIKDHDGSFGHNLELDFKDVKKYIKTLEKLGCSNFKFPYYYIMEMDLPSSCDMGEPLLFILRHSIKASEVRSKWNEKLECFRLIMEFHY